MIIIIGPFWHRCGAASGGAWGLLRARSGAGRMLVAETANTLAGDGDCGDGPRAGSEDFPAGHTAAGGHDSPRDRGRLVRRLLVGGILGKAIPLWLVAVLGLVIGAAVFVFVDRYPRLPRSR